MLEQGVVGNIGAGSLGVRVGWWKYPKSLLE